MKMIKLQYWKIAHQGIDCIGEKFQQSNTCINLGVIYRPQNTDINAFNECLSSILEKLKVGDMTFVTWWSIYFII